MGSKWAWVLMFVSVAWCLSQGCLDEERVALLQLKHLFNGGCFDYKWIDGEKNSDCCKWEGVEKNSDCCQWERVECSNSTGRVIKLDLYYAKNKNLGEWYLNASLFSVFEELESLDLRGNNIAGFVENEGLYKLSKLDNLEDLYLGSNMFNNDILSSLSVLPSLTACILSDNKLKGTIDLQSLDKSSRLKNLEYLYLRGNKLNNDILMSLDALPSLKGISLSNNNLKGTINLPSLSNLEELDLSQNNLDNSILLSIGALSSLKILYLEDIGLKGIVDISGSDKLLRWSNLKYLHLGSNKLNNVILSSPDAFPSLKRIDLTNNSLKGTIDLQGLNNLEELYLSHNNLDNSILSSIGALLSLKELYLNDNGLKGIVDISELHSLNNLEILRMSNNKIDKFIFSKDNTRMRNLSRLYISNISIHNGNNLLQLLSSFPSLEIVDLSYNNFNETTTTGDLVHLKNTKSLKELYMDNTNLNITFLQIIGLLTSPSLEILLLSNYGLQGTISRQGGGILVEFLYNQHNLVVVDLSSNNLTGEFPNWLLENNKNLFALNLANNSLGGCFQPPTHSHLNILDISKNFFHGHIPKEIGEYLPSLLELYLSHNHFDGSIPSSMGDMNSLEVLDLSYNQMFGKIPEHLVEGCSCLRLLLLANNSFQGQMFPSNFNLTYLERLQLDGNNFTGKIPDSLSNASHLKGLYLSDNNLSGRLPSWLGNLSLLEDIIIPNNHLKGPIAFEFFQLEYLTILNLADNNLSGSLPYGFKSPFIQQIHLSKNNFQGQLSDFLVNSSFLVTLDLGYNQLHGSIPTWINLNFNLKHLILRNNNLSGELPTQLCQLNQLRLIGFSHNNLSGHIPPCLELTALHDNRNSDVEIDSTHIMGSASNGGKIVQIRNEEIVEFTTKTSSYLYKGKVLTYLSGIDLSCNKLTGLIPQQVGNLTKIHTLNLSHNNLTGPIPLTFSKLKQIESLDLSYNNLNGKIPSQLVELNFLTSFSVAHNNLSGKTPERIAQFGTFEENCYVGNLLLCGPPLNKSCDITGPQPPMPRAPIDNGKDNDFIDLETFYMSFIGSYIIVLIGIGAVLYINPYWRRTWFYLLETWMISFYYFIVDNLPW